MNNKIGFWSVFAMVTGSQIGTGVFMLPASLAPYGTYSLIGWLISGLGAIALALVFAKLCSRSPKTGGPHVYVQNSFGPELAFFVGWTYWVISWVSTTAVVVTAITYLSPFIGDKGSEIYLALEIALLIAITILNLKGLKAAGMLEILLTLLKFLPLLVISLIALYFFDVTNFKVATDVSTLPTSKILGQVTLLTLWGFIGLETATTPAGSVENAKRTIPRAIIFGTMCVALLYFINSLAIIGLMPSAALAGSKAPYVDAAQIMFGGSWHLIISLIASVVCVGTLNAWMMTSGQIVLGLAEDGLMPKFFSSKNKNGAPFGGILTSCVGIIPLLVLTASENISKQIVSIIDFSVTAFLFVYLVCSFAHIAQIKSTERFKLVHYLYGFVAISFCLWIIFETPMQTLAIASLFVISGLPVYLLWYRPQAKNRLILNDNTSKII